MKKLSMKFSLVGLVCALVVCMVALVGCGSKAGNGTLSAETVAETGAFKVTANDAKADDGVSKAAALTLNEGDILIVSPDLEKGKLQVTLKDASGNVAFDQEMSGRVLSNHEVKAGTYDVTITCKEAGTTGSILVINQSAEEFAAQNKALDEALAEQGVTSAK